MLGKTGDLKIPFIVFISLRTIHYGFRNTAFAVRCRKDRWKVCRHVISYKTPFSNVSTNIYKLSVSRENAGFV